MIYLDPPIPERWKFITIEWSFYFPPEEGVICLSCISNISPINQHYSDTNSGIVALWQLSVITYIIELAWISAITEINYLDSSCPPFEPFKCREEEKCISIQVKSLVILSAELIVLVPQYLCDGAPDCHDGYDEDPKLCTAARRPPVEETSSFIYSLLLTHG